MQPEDQIKRINTVQLFWLATCCFFVAAVISIGGVTRLTHAGLSIVEWKPVTGILPPLTESDWLLEFNKYKQFPEFKISHSWMELGDFKFIFWMEYLHRLLARLSGLVFFLPFLFFWRKWNRSFKRIGLICLTLGVIQGGVGWYMVKSGLSGQGQVSPFRLTFHLFMGFSLYSLLFLSFLKMMPQKREPSIGTKPLPNKIYPLYHTLTLFLLITFLYGGMTAGLKAGWLYPTFPLMGDALIPNDAWSMNHLWKNFLYNPSMVQAVHRLLAYTTLLLSLVSLSITRGQKHLFKGFLILSLSLVIQMTLGALSVIYFMPTFLAAAHQLNFVFVLSAALYVGVQIKEAKIRLKY